MPDENNRMPISEVEFREKVLVSLAKIETTLPNHETRIQNIEKSGCPSGCSKWPGIISGVLAGGGTGGLAEAIKAFFK